MGKEEVVQRHDAGGTTEEVIEVQSVKEKNSGFPTECSGCGRLLDHSKTFEKNGYTYLKCSACGTVFQSNAPLYSEEVENNCRDAQRARRQLKFEDAITSAQMALSLSKNCYKAHWEYLIADNGIEIVQDHGEKPTCHRIGERSIFEQEHFKKAVENAPEEIAKNYKELARKYEEVRLGVLEKVKKEAPYDIFISFKKDDIDANGNKTGGVTKDAVWASQIYTGLKERFRDRRIFYSEMSLQSAAGTEFEPIIFRALSTAKVLLLIGTQTRYIESTWVKNEWMRYWRMMEHESFGKKKGTLLPICGDSVPQYPDRLSGLQAIKYDANFWTTIEKVLPQKFALYKDDSGIVRKTDFQKKYAKGKAIDNTMRFETRTFASVSAPVAGEEENIEFAKRALANQNFSGANRYIEAVLEKNPTSAKALFYKFHVDHSIKLVSENGNDDMEFCKKAVTNHDCIDLIDRIMGYANKEFGKELMIKLSKICVLAVKSLNPQSALKAFNIFCQFSGEKEFAKAQDILVNGLKEYAFSLVKKNEIQTAKEVFGSAVKGVVGINDEEIGKKYSAYNYNFAKILHENKKFDDALKYYQEAIDYNPNDPEYYFSRLLCKNGVMEDSFQCSKTPFANLSEGDLKAVIEKTPDATSGSIHAIRLTYIRRFLDLARFQVKANSLKTAKLIFDFIIQLIPSALKDLNNEFFSSFAEELLVAKQFDEATHYFEMILKTVDENSHEAYWGLLKASLLCENDEALVHTNRVIDLEECEYFRNAKIACQHKLIATNDYHLKYLLENDLEAYEKAATDKLFNYENDIEKQGFRLLAEGKFEEATNAFMHLSDFEGKTRGRGIITQQNARISEPSQHPNLYWGLLLAKIKVKSDSELASLAMQKKWSIEDLQSSDEYRTYATALNAYNKHYLNAGNLINFNKEYEDRLVEVCLTRRSLYQKHIEENRTESINRSFYTAKSKAKAAVFTGNLFYVLLLGAILTFGVLGSMHFYRYNISSGWSSVIMANLAFVFSGPVLFAGIIGGIIGFFGSHGFTAGIIVGGIAGVIVGALVLAGCYALIAIICVILLIVAVLLMVHSNKKHSVSIRLEKTKNKYIKHHQRIINSSDPYSETKLCSPAIGDILSEDGAGTVKVLYICPHCKKKTTFDIKNTPTFASVQCPNCKKTKTALIGKV